MNNVKPNPVPNLFIQASSFLVNNWEVCTCKDPEKIKSGNFLLMDAWNNLHLQCPDLKITMNKIQNLVIKEALFEKFKYLYILFNSLGLDHKNAIALINKLFIEKGGLDNLALEKSHYLFFKLADTHGIKPISTDPNVYKCFYNDIPNVLNSWIANAPIERERQWRESAARCIQYFLSDPNASSLDLNGRELSEFPPQLFIILAATNRLKDLNLSNNELTKLPAEIGCLTELEHLSLWVNKLTELPAEIGCLTRLVSLHLWHNQLTELPPEIGCLTRLVRLELGDNELTEVPAEIRCLTRLVDLDLFNSQLTEVPAEIGCLTQLKRLGLRGNNLISLPKEIFLLPQGCKIDLKRCPLSTTTCEELQELTSAADYQGPKIEML
jgi:Leucine rich repeat